MAEQAGPPGLNLLKFGPIRALVGWAGFPYVFQAVVLVVYVAFAVLAWGQFAPEGVSDKLYAKSNLVNLVIWGLWWPAMVWAAVLGGRAWCTVCPLELVANATERLGRILGFRQRVLGRWLRSGALIVAVYALIQMLVSGVHLHRVPAYTSLFLWGMLVGAGVVGFVFKDRAFCRGFCPVGVLLGTYGRGGMIAVRAESHQTCDDCAENDCVSVHNRHRLDARACPSLLNPPKLDTNRDCLVCGQCIKACKPDNMQLLVRRPFHSADAREPLASWPVTLFVLLVSGFVTYELCTEWKMAKAIFLWVPDHVSEAMGLSGLSGWVKGIWTLFVFPFLLWLILGGVTVLLRGAASLFEAWRRLALPLAVIVSAGHMAKGLAKFTSWGGFFSGAMRDPLGIKTAVALTGGAVRQPAALVPLAFVSVVSIGLLLAGAGFAIREARLAEAETYRRRIVPILMVAVPFGLIICGWLLSG